MPVEHFSTVGASKAPPFAKHSGKVSYNEKEVASLLKSYRAGTLDLSHPSVGGPSKAAWWVARVRAGFES